MFIAELRRPEGPPSGAPYSNMYRKAKETHELIFSWLSWLAVLLVGAYARRTTTTTTESHNMAAIIQIIGCQRHTALVCRVGLSRLCSATFEQLLAFGATFCGFSSLEQVLPFRAIFEQNIGLEHISSTKKSTISWKTSIHAHFLKAYHVINLLNT